MPGSFAMDDPYEALRRLYPVYDEPIDEHIPDDLDELLKKLG
jgi:hypothetical protein